MINKQYSVMDSMRERALPKYEKLDWPVLIDRIKKSGMAMDDIAKTAKMSSSTVYKIHSEKIGTSSLDSVCTLMQLYKDAVGGGFPVVGENNQL